MTFDFVRLSLSFERDVHQLAPIPPAKHDRIQPPGTEWQVSITPEKEPLRSGSLTQGTAV